MIKNLSLMYKKSNISVPYLNIKRVDIFECSCSILVKRSLIDAYNA